MALAASRTLLVLFVTFCTPGCGWTAEKSLRPQNGKQTPVGKVLRERWEPSIHLDGRPVDRFTINSHKPSRSHRFTKVSKDSHTHLLEDVDSDWVNLDGFAVLGNPRVNNSSAGSVRFSQNTARSHSTAERTTRVDRMTHPVGVTHTRTHRRAPQSSSGPRQPERVLAGTSLLERRQHSAKPQADQRKRHTPKLTSESVHVVSLQAQKAQGRSASANKPVTAKASTAEPPEYEPRDLSVRVMSPKSVLISWVDPAVEMGKIVPGTSRSYTVRFREKGESARWDYKDSTQRRVLIDTLSADSMYEFSVRISQGDKHGKWGVSVFQRTPESAPSGPPENFEVKSLRGKGTAVIVTWDPPEEPNGKIKEYILSYAPAMKPFGMKSTAYSGGTTTTTIDGLTPGERYIFKIRATNRRGLGPQSKVFSVVMPESRTASSSSSKSKGSHQTSDSLSKEDADHNESNPKSSELPEELTTTPKPRPAVPVNRRTRPLSQTRSYHSIFSVRSSVRNVLNRDSTKERARKREQKEDKIPTTPPPEETTTTEVVLETKEPNSNVSPVSEDEEDYGKEHVTTATPSLKVFTPSPTKPAYIRPNRRPVMIRVHKKVESKVSSSSSSGSSSSKLSSTSSATSSVSSSSADSSSSLPSSSSSSSSSHIQDSAASRQDYVASTYPETKNIYNKPSIAQAKPSTTSVKETNLQQTSSTSRGRGSSSAGRSSSSESGFSSRHGYGRRNPGIVFRGNSTRMLNGYKPAITSQLNLPSRAQSQATSDTHSSSKSQFAAPERNENYDTSYTLNPEKSRSTSRSTLDSQSSPDSPQSTLESMSHGSTALQGNNPTTSHNSASHPSAEGTSSFSHSASRTRTPSSSTTRNTHNSQGVHASLDQKTLNEKRNDDNDSENAEDANTKVNEPTLRGQPTRERRVKEGEDKSINEKPAVSHARLSPSFAERFPWLASRYPGRFGSNTRVTSSRQDGRTPLTRVSSSVGAEKPALRGAPTRVSGAVGAAGVSLIQETTEDLRTSSTRDSLKNGIGGSSFKPPLTRENTRSGDTRTSSSSSSASSNSGSYHSSSGRSDSSEPIHRETSKVNSNDHRNDYSGESGGESSRKVSDPTEAQKNTPMTSDIHRNAEDSESVGTDDTSSRTRPGTSSAVSPNYRHPGVGANARGRSPHLNRQFGGSRLPFRPQSAQNSRLGSSMTDSSSSSADSSSSHLPQPVLTSDRDVGSGTSVTKTGGLIGGSPQSTPSLSSSRDNLRNHGSRPRFPFRGKQSNGEGFKPDNGNGKNGRPNLTSAMDKDSTPHGTSKAAGQRFITGPDGTKWVVDLERGLLMNQDGQVLQDSRGKPKRVVLGEDGRTIFDHRGSPLVSQEGIALFGHGRDSQPVVNPKDKVLMVGGKPVLGLDIARPRTTTAAPTTTPEPTTTEWIPDESTTTLPFPTCPPGTFSKIDDYGYPVLDPEGILDCYPEEDSSGMEMDNMFTVSMMPDALALEKEEMIVQTTLLPSTAPTTTTASPALDTRPSSKFDLTGKKRFTAPYVNYIQKDPGAPCSLTEALEYLQVDVLENLLEKDSPAANQKQPPKNKPHNLTVVAMEGCHSFIILDWARPLKDDMVSGYMVYSASYDDVLNNRWSSRASTGTHLPVENLKPNSRYYFKVQAKNVFGLGPVSDTLTYVTESDDPLLIERPPGGEPIWIPFTFKYNPVHSSCKGSQYVKRTWYRKFVGVVLCNSLRYKIFMGDGLREPFYSIGDTFGQGEDHCQFVDSYRDGRTGPAYLSNNLPSAQGFYRAYRQEPVTFGVIGRRTSHPFVGWYECGVPIPGKW